MKILITIATIMSFTVAEAQVTRERNTNNQSVIRDSALIKKKIIGEKYDSLINKCNSKIVLLAFEIAGLQKQVEKLKAQIKQSEQDHENWLKKPNRTLSREQLQLQSQQKQNELDKKISDFSIQIDYTHKNINIKETEIKKLKSQINLLEKNKAAALSKL